MYIIGREGLGANSKNARENKTNAPWTANKARAFANFLSRGYAVIRCLLQRTINKQFT